jgi:HlyD family secretion protein
VALAEPASPLLRSNLRVDLLVVVGRKERALVLPRGPAVNGEGAQQLFVVRDGRARRTAVRIGLTGFDACEVVEGLSEGDEVILSETSEYEHMTEMRVR